MSGQQTITIGTRGSRLALWQAETVRDALRNNWPELAFDLQVIQTSGDWCKADGEVPLSHAAGGKAQFAKEIEEALLAGSIDLAVHSMKDMDSALPEGLVIPCMLPREDARDALLLRDRTRGIEQLVQLSGVGVGTVSVRRSAALQAIVPDLAFSPLRGNVETRISKLRGELAAEHPDLDATILAVAGVKRLGLEGEIDRIIEVEEMLPAAAQGAIGIEILANNSQLLKLLEPLNCLQTQMRVEAERSVLAMLGGSCHTPIGVYAEFMPDDVLWLRACLYMPDGSQIFAHDARGEVISVADAVLLGQSLGQELKNMVPLAVLEQIL